MRVGCGPAAVTGDEIPKIYHWSFKTGKVRESRMNREPEDLPSEYPGEKYVSHLEEG